MKSNYVVAERGEAEKDFTISSIVLRDKDETMPNWAWALVYAFRYVVYAAFPKLDDLSLRLWFGVGWGDIKRKNNLFLSSKPFSHDLLRGRVSIPESGIGPIDSNRNHYLST